MPSSVRPVDLNGLATTPWMCASALARRRSAVERENSRPSVLATIAKRTRAAPSPFSPLAPHRALATAENRSEIAPEMAKKSRDTGSDDLPRETENTVYRYLIAISKLRLGILTEQGEGS